MIASIKERMTAQEFMTLPESNQRRELMNGTILEGDDMPSPNMFHQDIVGNVYVMLRRVGKHGKAVISPMDVQLDGVNVLQPDVFWVAFDNPCHLVDGKFWLGAPDLVVEVLSEGTALRDKKTKFKLYENHGVKEYWLIDPLAKYIEVWRRIGETFVQVGVYGADETFVSLVLNQAITVAEVFAV
jgi:Uma2 family endonuclease